MPNETTPGLRRERRRRLLWVLAISAVIGAGFGVFLSLTFGAIVPGRLFASALSSLLIVIASGPTLLSVLLLEHTEH